MGNNSFKDNSMVTIGIRIPEYLSDFIKSYEDKEKSITKTDIMRKIIEIVYNEPWLLENYLSTEKVNTTKLDEIEKENQALRSQINDITEQIANLQTIHEEQKNQMHFFQNVTEKLLNVSFAQIKQMPDQILEQLYAGYLEKGVKD